MSDIEDLNFDAEWLPKTSPSEPSHSDPSYVEKSPRRKKRKERGTPTKKSGQAVDEETIERCRKNFPEVYQKIRQMRQGWDAPVDHLGGRNLYDSIAAPNVRRFHKLIGLLISSQTRDEINEACMRRLHSIGCCVENLIEMPIEDLAKILYPVGFYNNKAKFIQQICIILRDKYRLSDEEYDEVSRRPEDLPTATILRTPKAITWSRLSPLAREKKRRIDDSLPEKKSAKGASEETPAESPSGGHYQDHEEQLAFIDSFKASVHDAVIVDQTMTAEHTQKQDLSALNPKREIVEEDGRLERRQTALKDKIVEKDAGKSEKREVKEERLGEDLEDDHISAPVKMETVATPTKVSKKQPVVEEEEELILPTSWLTSHYDVPRTYEELIDLPGFGPKMATLYMLAAWGETVGIGVDVHVHRVANRLGWVCCKDAVKSKEGLESFVPREEWKNFNVTIVGFGQQICHAMRPACGECLLRDSCPYYIGENK